MQAQVTRCLLWLPLLALTSCATCDPTTTEDPPAGPPPSPVRRLTQEELNQTLHDLFPEIPAAQFPAVSITEDNGKDFAQETIRQVVSDLYIEQLRAGVNVVAHAAFVAHDPRDDGSDEDAAVAAIIEDLLPRAFRRSVDDAEVNAFVDFYAARKAEFGFVAAYELMLQAVMQSPAFLYRLELEDTGAEVEGRVPVSSIEMATRLSYFFWGTMPDAELLQAGADGDLSDPDQIAAQAERLLADPRSMKAIQSFHRQWLDFDRVLLTNKSPERFPQYNEFLRTEMRDEASRFIDLVFQGDAKLRTLLTSRQTRLNPSLGAVYGVDVNEDDSLVDLPGERSGILTQAQFLSARGHGVEGSPVLRGVFILDRLMCEAPPVPGGNIDTTPPQPEEDGDTPRTNRDRYREHSRDPSCLSCHKSIDGVGFGLEGFDSIGQFRTVDNGQPVDASGSLDDTSIGGTFDGAVALGEALAASPVVSSCVAKHWFRFANGRRELASDGKDLDALTAEFDSNDGDVRVLLKAIVQSDAFRLRRPS